MPEGVILHPERLIGLDNRIITCVQNTWQATKHQWDTLVVFGYRSAEEQDALYAQGRKTLLEVNTLRQIAGMTQITQEENKVVTRAKKGQSAHNYHAAVDLVGELLFDKDKSLEWTDMDYFLILKQEADKLGLVTLWSIGDFGHVETENWRSL